MQEARKNEYFVDGFLIRHFGTFPVGIDKEDFFEEQKVFLLFLIGNIPDLEMWQKDIYYRNKKSDIENMTIEDIKISESDIDLCEIHGDNIEDIKKSRLKEEKKIQISELRKSFGFKEEIEDIEIKDIDIESKSNNIPNDKSVLWDILNGKGLKNNG